MHHIVLKGQVFQMVNPSSNVVFRSKPKVLYGRPMSALDSWIMVEKCGSSMCHDMTFVNMKAKASACTYSQRFNLDTGALEGTSLDFDKVVTHKVYGMHQSKLDFAMK